MTCNVGVATSTGEAISQIQTDSASIDAVAFKAVHAGMLPTYYCRSISASERAVEVETLDPDRSLFPSSFVYTPEEWHTQFIARPHAHVECLGRRGEWAALVERSTEFDRVHGAVAEHYKVSRAVSEPHATTLDYIVAAAAG